MKERTSITLRQRLLPSGRTTLYLDYICNGKRRVESLKLFLEPETSRADKQKNRETLKYAETILASARSKSKTRSLASNRTSPTRQTSMSITMLSALSASAKRAVATGETGCLPDGITVANNADRPASCRFNINIP